jgi:hypothetical protein
MTFRNLVFGAGMSHADAPFEHIRAHGAGHAV